MTACAFSIPAYDYWSALEPKIVKCTFCYHRIKEGRPTACAEACPAGALTFGKRDDLIKLARKKIMGNPDTYIDHIYGEHEVGGTSWLYLSKVPFDQIGLPTNIPNRALIEETKGFLTAVPVVFTVWPAVFGMCYAALRHRDEPIHENKGEEEVEK
jgi:ferredoxin